MRASHARGRLAASAFRYTSLPYLSLPPLAGAALAYSAKDVVVAFAGVAMATPFAGVAAAALLVLDAPVANPVISSAGSGRVYLSGLLIGVVVVSGAWAALRRRSHAGITVYLLSVLYIGLLLLQKSSVHGVAAVAWGARPLQFFLVTASLSLLARGRKGVAEALLRWAFYGASLGCVLGVAHSLIPAIDPFAFTRPADIPWTSKVGSYVRASGGFVYPNNFGMYGAYAAVAAVVIYVRGVDLPKRLTYLVLFGGTCAVVFSASRAAAITLIAGTLVTGLRAYGHRRAARRVRELVGRLALPSLLLLVSLGASASAMGIVQARLVTATGTSLAARVQAWGQAWSAFSASPIFGAGISDSRLDSSFLLYLVTSGIVGALLLVAMGVATGRVIADREAWIAIVVGLLAGAVVQDSLGQTLVTWFPAALAASIGAQHSDDDPGTSGGSGDAAGFVAGRDHPAVPRPLAMIPPYRDIRA
jgi:hypothetical protein